MQIKNEAMLITYSDSLGKNMKDLKFVLETYFKESIGGVHLLPFFPSTGDRGFHVWNNDIDTQLLIFRIF